MNKKIVITGATKGIGKAIAEKFVANGFNLAFCARNKQEVALLAGKLQRPGQEIIAMPCDVSDKAALKKFADTVTERFGYADVLVNNAGVFTPGQVYNEEDGALEKLIETNLYSAYNLSRWLIPGMIEKKSGHIFNMCSVASIGAYPNGGSYSISKFALLGLSKALREELMDFNIRVTSLIPGAIYTDSWKDAGLPESRFMKTEDIADLVWSIYNLSANTVVEDVVLRPVAGDI
jgi:short-subunit dehydrogenase